MLETILDYQIKVLMILIVVSIFMVDLFLPSTSHKINCLEPPISNINKFVNLLL